MAEYHASVLWPCPIFLNNRVRSISLIFFEVGIPNLVCECIFGWRSVTYHFLVIVILNLTSDLILRFIMSELLTYKLR